MASTSDMIARVKGLTGTTVSTGDSAADVLLDENIRYIVEAAEGALSVLLGDPPDGIPEKLSYIVVDVSCARFNRIASEGAASHALGGETLTFTEDDFSRYMGVISAYKRNKAGGGLKIKFL